MMYQINYVLNFVASLSRGPRLNSPPPSILGVIDHRSELEFCINISPLTEDDFHLRQNDDEDRALMSKDDIPTTIDWWHFQAE